MSRGKKTWLSGKVLFLSSSKVFRPKSKFLERKKKFNLQQESDMDGDVGELNERETRSLFLNLEPPDVVGGYNPTSTYLNDLVNNVTLLAHLSF